VGTHARLHGITAMLMAVAAFSGMDAFLKLFSEHYAPMQVAAMRGGAALPFVLLLVRATGKFSDLKPQRIWMHVLRGALTVVVMYTFVKAVTILSLADAYSIFLAAPLIVTALSVPLLKEHVGIRRWIAIGVGMIGVLTMLRPSASTVVTLGGLAALVSAVTYALNAIALRALTRTETTGSVIFSTLLIMTLIAALLALPAWKPISPDHLPWLVAIGVLGTLGQYFLTVAFRSAPAAVVSPFEYTALLWGIAIDWAVWSVLPSHRVYIGGGIVVASGLYLIWRETRATQPSAATSITN